MRSVLICVALAVCGRFAAADDGSLGSGARLTYEVDVRPILKAHCFHCHGENGEKEGALDLRLRRLIAVGGESGPAIVPGDPESSVLIERVRSGEMPPGDDKRLSETDIRKLVEWIAAGAITAHDEPESIGDGPVFTHEERNYWAFQPVVRPVVPMVKRSGQVRTPIDAFLLAKLESARQGFQPDEEPRRLLRRLSFDLHGLPPAPDAVTDFAASMSASEDDVKEADAHWARTVDRLLASPHYGERWGRHWLDVAGYADSEGYTDEDRVRPHAYRYRDYVIKAFNDDKPFDEFIVEQLAGDELVPLPHNNLSPEGIAKLTATGFLRMAPDGTASGGLDQSVARNQVLADTLQIVGTSLLGLTINCAQCHDHRYDPIPQADYYRIRAIFEPALDWKNWKAPPARQISLYTDADRELAKSIEIEAVKIDQERQKKADEYITRTLEEELLLVPENLRNALRTAYRTATAERSTDQKNLLAEYPSVDKISVGSLYLYDRRRDERASKLDQERPAKEKKFVEETAQRELARVAEADRPIVDAALKLEAGKRSDEQRKLLEKYPGVAVTTQTLAEFNPEAAAELERDRATAVELRASKAAIDLKKFTDKAAEVRATKPVEGFVRALTEAPGSVPSTFLFARGDHEQPKEQLAPADLSIFGVDVGISNNDESLPTTGRRLKWARYLTSGQHPLVARVLVNRIWLHHFGRGLVNSPGDFGYLGDRPTHPGLLDWLAAEFVESGWSVKHLHRLILKSTAYRQSSRVSEVASGFEDPENRLLARFPMLRLESEVLRDAVLTVSGKLNPQLAGEPVPVMEDEVGQIILGIENLDGERKPTKPIPLNGQEFRRSVYVQVRRTRTLSLFEAFDAPAMTPNCDRRSYSTVTPQSLLMMNSDFALEYSDEFADRLIRDAGEGIRDQIVLGWSLAFSLEPTAEDISASEQFIELQRNELKQQTPKPADADVQRRSLSSFCQALLSSNRFLYVE